MTNIAALQLVERGVIGIDDPVYHVSHSLNLFPCSNVAPITTNHLHFIPRLER
jgi:CubicO group peptidase (beta-lactamase class C family)